LEEAERRFKELTDLLGRGGLDPSLYAKYAKERAKLERLINTTNEYNELEKEIASLKELLKEEDEELVAIAKEELEELIKKRDKVKNRLNLLLFPSDPNDERDVIMEIRAGTGGDESSLFVQDLFRMYTRYINKKGWKIEIMNSHPTSIGGFKEIVFSVRGEDVYGHLKYEAGVHRVQRIPVTESSGRIHTSAATVAVLPEAEEVEVEIRPEDIRMDVYRSSGPGGQSVNTTDSAVRLTHLPTGIVVTCQDEKSQHKNRAKAMRVLRARILDMMRRKEKEKIDRERRLQVRSGDRSEKIRTYNYPQNRLTDHRIGLTLHKLDAIMDGEMDELIFALMESELKKVS
jgi:peptide chain release factor 1